MSPHQNNDLTISRKKIALGEFQSPVKKLQQPKGAKEPRITTKNRVERIISIDLHHSIHQLNGKMNPLSNEFPPWRNKAGGSQKFYPLVRTLTVFTNENPSF